MRIIFGGLVAGIILHVWGMAMWMALPFYNDTINKAADPAALQSAMTAQGLETGMYYVPGMDNEQSDAWKAAYAAGPRAFMAVSTGEQPINMGKAISMGIGANVLFGFLTVLLLAMARLPRYSFRVVFVVILFALLGLRPSLMNHIWMFHSSDYTIVSILDSVVAGLLVGLVIAALVKPPKAAEA